MTETVRHLWRAALMAAFLGGALWVLAYQWVRLEPSVILGGLRTIPPGHLAAAVLAAVLGHLAITGYDAVAAKAAGVTLPFRKVAAAAFIGSAFGMNAGYPLLTGTPFRVRVYALWGLGPGAVLKVVAGSAFAYWTGSLAMAGGVMALLPPGGIAERFGANPRLAGFALLASWGFFLILPLVRRRPLSLGRWTLSAPSPRQTLAALGVSALDWGLAAATLYFLMPPGSGLTYPAVLAVYLPAALGVWLLQIPAGLGVLDTAVLLLLPPGTSEAPVLGGLLLFRGIYYLLPLLAAAGLFFALEGRGHFRRRRRFLRKPKSEA